MDYNLVNAQRAMFLAGRGLLGTDTLTCQYPQPP